VCHDDGSGHTGGGRMIDRLALWCREHALTFVAACEITGYRHDGKGDKPT
jgi:hypothetical protein